MIILNLFLISVIWVLILDIAGFSDEIRRIIGKILKLSPGLYQNLSLKPLTCSLCMTWWSGVIYLLVVHEFTFLNITLTLLFACFTTTTKDLIFLVQDLFTHIFTQILKHLKT